MANDRDSYSNDYGRDAGDYGRDYGSGRDYTYSSARDYQASGQMGGRDDRNYRGGGTGYGERSQQGGNRDYYGGRSGQGDNDRGGYGQGGFGQGGYGQNSYGQRDQGNYGSRNYGDDRGGYGQNNYGNDRQSYGAGGQGGYGGSYGQNRTRDWGSDRSQQRSYGGQPQGYSYQDRGFFDRAGDEVRSWFGDEDAERRRDMDQRYDERLGGSQRGNTTGYGRDEDYHSWRRTQIDQLDRDYHEYRQENAKKFENEFGTWRSNRQTQRTSLSSVNEHMEVVGSDGQHVGTVDKVRGDRIILTKNDADAGGRHHSIPSSWLQSVDDKVTISKTADEAKKQWRDEERSGALFGEGDKSDDKDGGSTNLNRSFSGTY
ncbi:hypothetical protein SAMN06297144_0128 [Sphingomonas guangdongensis]|uniref:DUF2171 domain-containing protein n=1 Tax=Sphingomonas guangdongensis TaxID=1141890 RepID=A0A285QEY4_9SPHN|nr:DUF2171 domain-containing protein [Sphingomonas guangdongensis]SOB78622.1 hypothetical protein SAMN06297144_0128 [Sphingomonas guangdongensis]